MLAASCMAIVLVGSGLGWTTVLGTPVQLAIRLAAAIALGGSVYLAVLLLSWLASGQPPGAEADAIQMLKSRLRRAI